MLADKEASKLTAIVTYKTRYTYVNGKMITISFGLGGSISVNAIIGLPTFRAWELVFFFGVLMLMLVNVLILIARKSITVPVIITTTSRLILKL